MALVTLDGKNTGLSFFNGLINDSISTGADKPVSDHNENFDMKNQRTYNEVSAA